jgi:putative SOS response-associated peptidase YedK
MCARYINTLGPEVLSKKFGVQIPTSQGTHRYNIAPSQQVLAITAKDGELRVRLLRWGLIPSWAKDLKAGNRMINARVETIAAKGNYAGVTPDAHHRAFMLADGYFEWQKPERRGQPHQPFYFQVEDRQPFAFAALWTAAKIQGEWIHTCTLLTCETTSNPLVHAIHDRMPVILPDPHVQHACRFTRRG